MPRTTILIALLLAAAACNRQPAANAVTTTSSNVAAPAEAPAALPAAVAPADMSAISAVEAEAEVDTAEEVDVTAPREREPEAERAEGCAGEIGLPAARRLVAQCIDASPATRPPCNTANSCDMIRDEIKRGCDFLGEDAPAYCKEAG